MQKIKICVTAIRVSKRGLIRVTVMEKIAVTTLLSVPNVIFIVFFFRIKVSASFTGWSGTEMQNENAYYFIKGKQDRFQNNFFD